MKIEYLADHKEVIPTLAQWSFEEWAYLHPGRTIEDVERLIAERANKTKIPIALVAFENKELLGTICIKMHDMETRLDLTPWLAGLYVAKPWRRRGVGSALVKAIEIKALEFAIEKLYLYTPESENFYSRLGWRVKEKIGYHSYPVTIMEKEIFL